MLRVIRELGDTQPVELSPTFMGAHEVPVEYRDAAAGLRRLDRAEMIPAVARERPGRMVRRVLREGRVHAGRIARDPDGGASRGHEAAASTPTSSAPSGGSQRRRGDRRAVGGPPDLRRRSRRRTGWRRPASSRRCCRSPSFYLKLGRFAPARMLIDRDVAVALATDVNPGGGFSPSMPFAMTLACFGMGLTFEEALVGATINAAYALDRHDRSAASSPASRWTPSSSTDRRSI